MKLEAKGRPHRLVAVLTATVLAVAACSSSAVSSPVSTGAATSAVAPPSAPASAAPASAAASAGAQAAASAPSSCCTTNGPCSAVYVMSDHLGDKGPNDSLWSGMQRASSQLGVTVKALQADPNNPSLWLQNMQAVSDGSWNVVVTAFGQQLDNLKQTATQHPNIHYIYLDQALNLLNVWSVLFAQNEGSYLAGVLAGLVTTDTKDFPLSKGAKNVGLLGGQDLPVIEDFIVGFKQGVLSVDPSIKIQVAFAGSFADPNAGYTLAKTMYQKGADIVFAVAGGTGLGVLKASADMNRYSIGVDQDQNGLYPGHVLASMVKRFDNAVFTMIKAAKDCQGQWGTTLHYGLQDQGVALIIDQKDVPQSVQAKIAAADQQIASGAIKVNVVPGF